jgi:hypothetical protein
MLLWHKMATFAIFSCMLSATLPSGLNEYTDTTSEVSDSETFSVSIELRQVCFLFTILFNVLNYINDQAVSLKSMNKGIDIRNEKKCVLLYAFCHYC